jgi:predicted RNase H-like nuclease (RuvC/YqgF family)
MSFFNNDNTHYAYSKFEDDYWKDVGILNVPRRPESVQVEQLRTENKELRQIIFELTRIIRKQDKEEEEIKNIWKYTETIDKSLKDIRELIDQLESKRTKD